MTAAASTPLGFRDVLRLTVMRRVWYAQVVSLLGDFLALFAVISVVSFRMHGTAAQVTAVQISYMLPMAILGPLSGVFVDRWPLKQTLVLSDLARAVLVGFLLLSTSLWQVYLVLAAISTVSSFFAPAQSVTIRTHVPPNGLLSANALMQMAMMGIRIVGPAAAGVLVATFGPGVCYAIDGLSFVASASLIGSVAILRPSGTPGAMPSAPVASNKVVHDMLEGFRFILHHRAVLFVVMAMAAGLFTIGCFGPLIAIYVRESLHASTRSFGLVSAMVGVGLLLGTQGLRLIAMRVDNDVMVLSGLAGIGAGVLLLGAVPNFSAALAATFAIGFAFAAIMVPAQTLLQRETPHTLMGRISSTVMSVIFFAQLLGLVASGILAQLIGVRPVFFLCAALAGLLAAGSRVVLRQTAAEPVG
jgi:DHA3 family macrolide efflux protein-like MFS transporter